MELDVRKFFAEDTALAVASGPVGVFVVDDEAFCEDCGGMDFSGGAVDGHCVGLLVGFHGCVGAWAPLLALSSVLGSGVGGGGVCDGVELDAGDGCGVVGVVLGDFQVLVVAEVAAIRRIVYRRRR